MMGKEARVNDRVIGADDHVVGMLARRRVAIAQSGSWQRGEAGGNALADAHVTILTVLLVAQSGRRRFELTEGVLQAESVRPEHIMAAATEARGNDLEERDGILVDIPSPNGRVRLRFRHAPAVGVREHLGQDFRPERAIDWLVEIAGHERLPAGHLPPRLIDAVTHDAGDTFAGRRGAVHLTYVERLVQGHADRCVAANTKVAVRPAGQLEELVGEGIEYRT
jgi:hypothetical protein